MRPRQSGSALVVGLMLLALITLLGLAGAAAAQVELQLARNELFRENAATAASAGIEIALRHVTANPPDTVPTRIAATVPGTTDRYEADIRLLGEEPGLPQIAGANLAGAHFDILSTGYAARGAVDRQRAIVMRVVASATPVASADCEPIVTGVRCTRAGELRRLSWQRLAD